MAPALHLLHERRDPETKTEETTTRANKRRLLGLAVVSAISQPGSGQIKKKGLGDPRKSLKRLDPDKEIKVNSFDFLCWIWRNLGSALKNQIAPQP
jgi:hypothetical protein